MTGITGTQFSNIHATSNNPGDYRPSRLEIYLDPDQRKARFGNPQHQNIPQTNDLDQSIKPQPQTKRLAYGDNFTHFPNI